MKATTTLRGVLLCLLLQASVLEAEGKEPSVPARTGADRQPTITVTDLGTFMDLDTVPGDLNNHGEIVGFSPSNGGLYGFFWSAETGFVEVPGFGAWPRAINDKGQVVGTYTNGEAPHGFSWNARDGAFVDLGSFFPVDINNRGAMVGYCLSSTPLPCFYEDGQVDVLPLSDYGGGSVSGLNDKGVVAGATLPLNDYGGELPGGVVAPIADGVAARLYLV